MHPVLFEVPWPATGIPLWPVFALVAVAGIGAGYLGVRRELLPMAAWGAAASVLAIITWVLVPGARVAGAPFVVRTWGACLALALGVGSVLWLLRGGGAGLSRDVVARAAAAAFLGGVVGARLLWALLHPSALESVTGVVSLHEGGLSSWGALAGGTLAAYAATRGSEARFSELLASAAPSFTVGIVIVRIGCWFEGCDFGTPLGPNAPRVLEALGTFPKDSPAWVAHVLERGLSPSAEHSLAVHPVALYEALAGVALTGFVMTLGRGARARGLSFGSALLSYLALRVSLDSLREDRLEVRVSIGLFSAALLAGLVFSVRKSRRTRK